MQFVLRLSTAEIKKMAQHPLSKAIGFQRMCQL